MTDNDVRAQDPRLEAEFREGRASEIERPEITDDDRDRTRRWVESIPGHRSNMPQITATHDQEKA